MDVLYSRALTHFMAAYDCRNLRSAAEAVHVTQPAVSKSIGKLEDHIGMPLFNRTPNGVESTEFAHILRRHAQNIMNEARFVETEIAALTSGSGGLLRIGVGPAWSLSVFPRLLIRFQATFPNIDVEVQTGVTDHLLPLLKGGDIDLWLGSLHDVEETPDIAVRTIGWSSMTVFAQVSHPLAGTGKARPVDLTAFAWASFTNDHCGLEWLSRYFTGRDLPDPRVALRLSRSHHVLGGSALRPARLCRQHAAAGSRGARSGGDPAGRTHLGFRYRHGLSPQHHGPGNRALHSLDAGGRIQRPRRLRFTTRKSASR